MRDVYILGQGQTKRGYFPDRDIRSLLAEAAYEALGDVKMEIGEVQQLWLSHYPSLCDMQMTAGQVVVDTLGVSSRMGCICIEQACTSGGQTLHDAWLAVASGYYDCVLVLGVAKMQDSFDHDNFWESGYSPFLDRLGIKLNIKQAHLGYNKQCGVTEEDYAAYFELLWWYGVRNPVGMSYGLKAKTREDYYNTPYSFYPYRPGTNPYAADGAAAVVLASKEILKRYSPPAEVSIVAITHKEESSYYAHGLDYSYGEQPQPYILYHSASVKNAIKEAMDKAGINPADLDVYQPHDSSIEVAWSYIDCLGHPDIPMGTAPKFVTRGGAYPGGTLPMMTSSTSKSGQARGAEGLDLMIENYLQLTGQAGERQVPIKHGLAASTTSPGRPSIIVVRREN